MVSIIIAAYNGAKFLDKFSLPSLGRQSFQDWEAIIVNDGSRDETKAVVEKWLVKDKRLRYIEHGTNRGLAAALNTGVANSRGEIIAFLEQDDIWLKDKLAIQVEKLKAENLLTTASYFAFNTKTGKIDDTGGGNFSTLIGRREIIEKLFPLPEDKKYLGIEDGILAARLEMLISQDGLSREKIGTINEPLVIFSYNHPSLSGHQDTRLSRSRYRAVLDLFAAEKSSALNDLKVFWRRHESQNRLAGLCPSSVQAGLRRLSAWRKKLENRHRFLATKKSPSYQEALEIIEKL